MKKEILKLFYLPVILWILVSFFYFVSLYNIMKSNINHHIKEIQNIVINEKKQQLKKDVDNFKTLFFLLKNAIYSSTQEELGEIINLPIKNRLNKLIETDFAIVGLIPRNKKFKYSIYKNHFIVLNYHKKRYLVVLKNSGEKVYIIGIRKKCLDNFITENILKYLDLINKNKQSYIAIGKITSLKPDKNGNFGYIYYMPPRLKELQGLVLSVKKPDMRGNLFREKYLKCFEHNKSCFVSYYWKNPITSKIEKKISYFEYLKEFNLSVIKGIYESQILKEINSRVEKYKKETVKIFEIAIIVYFVILLIFILLQQMLFNKIKLNLIKNYEELKKGLIKSVYFDSLTSLPNRNKLIEDIKKYSSLILIDIEDFSDINDVFGFEKGDKVLKELSAQLKNEYKNVYRIGSDEFAVCFFEKITGDFLKRLINKKIKIENINISLIIGASNFKKRLYESAEMALKFAIRLKNKKYLLYDESMYLKQKEKLDKINLLKNALEKKDIIPYYQGIVDRNGNIVKYESLMRIKINGKIESPYFFMDLIKEARLYSDFSRIMIEKVLKDIEIIDKKISINLSYDDIANKEMRNFILNSINSKNAKKIIFEILESESIQNYEEVKSFINNAKEKGIEIAIDDFGSGYSNFVRVLNLEPDIIKIDASLIKNIKELKNQKMVELIVDFAKSFKLKTVAEFVSSKEIFDIVKNMGIDEFQGFYFCEPQPFDKISFKKGANED